MIQAASPTMIVRKDAYERVGVIRADLDSRFNLTEQEFRVEGNLIAIGPLPSDDLVGPMTDYLEATGLIYFDDFFELSGNWPEWLRIYAM